MGLLTAPGISMSLVSLVLLASPEKERQQGQEMEWPVEIRVNIFKTRFVPSMWTKDKKKSLKNEIKNCTHTQINQIKTTRRTKHQLYQVPPPGGNWGSGSGNEASSLLHPPCPESGTGPLSDNKVEGKPAPTKYETRAVFTLFKPPDQATHKALLFADKWFRVVGCQTSAMISHVNPWNIFLVHFVRYTWYLVLANATVKCNDKSVLCYNI